MGLMTRWGGLGCAVALAACLGACGGPGSTSALARGTLLSIGKEHLVLQSEHHVMFVSLDEGSKRRVAAMLKTGDRITLIGRQDTEEVSSGRRSAEISAILRDDGTLIALNP